MPVVINEFEVVPQAPPGAPVSETGQVTPPPEQDEREMENIMERIRERMLRVWAH